MPVVVLPQHPTESKGAEGSRAGLGFLGSDRSPCPCQTHSPSDNIKKTRIFLGETVKPACLVHRCPGVLLHKARSIPGPNLFLSKNNLRQVKYHCFVCIEAPAASQQQSLAKGFWATSNGSSVKDSQSKLPGLSHSLELGLGVFPSFSPELKSIWVVAVNLQRSASLRIYVSGWDKADAPTAEGFAQKPWQSWNEEADDFYAVTFGESQFIPCCSSVVLCGCAPAFDWKPRQTKAFQCEATVKTYLLEKTWARSDHDFSLRRLPLCPLRFIVLSDSDLCSFFLKRGL